MLESPRVILAPSLAPFAPGCGASSATQVVGLSLPTSLVGIPPSKVLATHMPSVDQFGLVRTCAGFPYDENEGGGRVVIPRSRYHGVPALDGGLRVTLSTSTVDL